MSDYIEICEVKGCMEPVKAFSPNADHFVCAEHYNLFHEKYGSWKKVKEPPEWK